MRKQDALPPVWVDGPPFEPAATLLAWIDSRAARRPGTLFRLPFTFTAASTREAALGLPEVAAATHRLGDAPLGIPLAERLRALRGGDAGTLAVWLAVRPGALLGDDGSGGLPVFTVFAVHERVPVGAPTRDLRAQASRGPDCLALRRLGQGHCARGPARCPRCAAAAAEPATPALLDLCPDQEQAARPTIAVVRAGARSWAPYDVLRRFASREEAQEFAARHGLEDVALDAAEA